MGLQYGGGFEGSGQRGTSYATEGPRETSSQPSTNCLVNGSVATNCCDSNSWEDLRRGCSAIIMPQGYMRRWSKSASRRMERKRRVLHASTSRVRGRLESQSVDRWSWAHPLTVRSLAVGGLGAVGGFEFSCQATRGACLLHLAVDSRSKRTLRCAEGRRQEARCDSEEQSTTVCRYCSSHNADFIHTSAWEISRSRSELAGLYCTVPKTPEDTIQVLSR